MKSEVGRSVPSAQQRAADAPGGYTCRRVAVLGEGERVRAAVRAMAMAMAMGLTVVGVVEAMEPIAVARAAVKVVEVMEAAERAAVRAEAATCHGREEGRW